MPLVQPLIIKDEGTTQGAVNAINCVGSGIAATVSGGVATLTVAGAAPGGSSGDVQVNNAGAFAGVSPSAGTFLGVNAGAWAAVNTATFIALATTPATSGLIRVPFSAGQDVIRGRRAAGTEAPIISQQSGVLNFGDLSTPSNWETHLYGGNFYITGSFDIRMNGGAGDAMRVEGVNATIGDGAGSYGASSSGVLGFKNATAVPTGNPTGGGVQYAQSGAGKWRGSGGTITTFGPADPHCPRCGEDHGHEWETPQIGSYTFVCKICLLDMLERLDSALGQLGIDLGLHVRDFTIRRTTDDLFKPTATGGSS